MDNIIGKNWFPEFESVSHLRHLKKNEIYAFQGEPLDKVGLLLSGKITATAFTADGAEIWLMEYVEGDFVGLLPFHTHDAVIYELRASHSAKLRDVSFKKLRELSQTYPELYDRLAKDVASRLDQALAQLLDVQSISVRGRICKELLRLSIPIGIQPDQSIIRPSPVFTELAKKLNSTRETVSRTVSDLQAKGYLSRKPGAILIHKPDSFENLINSI